MQVRVLSTILIGIDMGNHKRKEPVICKQCGKQFYPNYSSKSKFCSIQCQRDYMYREYIERWKNGEETGVQSKYDTSNYIRRYLFDKYHNKCQKCGWGEVNPFTNKVPLQIHHVDGNCLNNKESNLQLLCPNCHSLTENYGSRNRVNGSKRLNRGELS